MDKEYVVEIEATYGQKLGVAEYKDDRVSFNYDDYIDGDGLYRTDYIMLFTEAEADNIVSGLGGKDGLLKPTKTHLFFSEEEEE